MEEVFVLLLTYCSSGVFRLLGLDYRIADILLYLIEIGIRGTCYCIPLFTYNTLKGQRMSEGIHALGYSFTMASHALSMAYPCFIHELSMLYPCFIHGL